MAKRKLKKFYVSVRVEVQTDVIVAAESLEDAILKGRELDVTDVVEFDSSFNDGSIQVTGAFETTND